MLSMNEDIDELGESLEKLYNEKETYVLRKEEATIDLTAIECELNVLNKRKEQLPRNVGANIFWIVVFTGVVAWILLTDSGIFSLFKVCIIVLLPAYIKMWINTVKSIVELIDNLDTPLAEKMASKKKEPNINTRINNLAVKIAKQRVVIENYDKQILELKKQINKIIADKGF